MSYACCMKLITLFLSVVDKADLGSTQLSQVQYQYTFCLEISLVAFTNLMMGIYNLISNLLPQYVILVLVPQH